MLLPSSLKSKLLVAISYKFVFDSSDQIFELDYFLES